MSNEAFTHDVFLSHSAKDKGVVRAVAERLRQDGLRVWFEEWELPVAASRQSAASCPCGPTMPIWAAGGHSKSVTRGMRRRRFLPPSTGKTPRFALTC